MTHHSSVPPKPLAPPRPAEPLIFGRIPRTKAITATIGLPLFGLVLLWLPAWGFSLLALVIAPLAAHEFGRLFLPFRVLDRWLLVGAAGLGVLAASLLPAPQVLALLPLGLVLILATELFRAPLALQHRHAPLTLVAGFAYTGILASIVVLVRQLPQGNEAVLWLFLATWGGDFGAGSAGMLLGRHHLPARINARKTWEGILGGTLAATLLTLWLLPTGTASGLAAVLIGLAVGLLGQAGDLFESLLKRTIGITDSGSFVPGQGGVLDRVDSVLFVAPLVYVVLAGG